MKKVICDACGAELTRANSFVFLVHLKHGTKYVDSDMNPISGRQEDVDLCNKCYNEVVGAAVSLLLKKQQEKQKG